MKRLPPKYSLTVALSALSPMQISALSEAALSGSLSHLLIGPKIRIVHEGIAKERGTFRAVINKEMLRIVKLGVKGCEERKQFSKEI